MTTLLAAIARFIGAVVSLLALIMLVKSCSAPDDLDPEALGIAVLLSLGMLLLGLIVYAIGHYLSKK